MTQAIKNIVAGTLAAFAAVAYATDTYYLKATERSDTYSTLAEYGFVNPDKWGLGATSGDAAAGFDSTADYIVRKSSLRLVVQGATDKTFAGGRLILGQNGSHGALLLYTVSPNVTTFGNNGLRLVHGCILCTFGQNQKIRTSGPIEVNTYSSGYTDISFNYDNSLLRHDGPLSIASGKTLTVGRLNAFGGRSKNGTFEVLGSCAGIYGTLMAASPSNTLLGATLETWDTTLALGSTEIPGTVEIGTNCRLRTLHGTNVLSVANLSFAANTWLDVPYDTNTFSFGSVTATTSFSVADKVTITAPALVPRAAKATVLTVPKSSGVTLTNFELADSVDDPYRSLSVEEEGGNVLVCITYSNIPVYPTIIKTVLDSNEAWSDGLGVHGDADYVIDASCVTNSTSAAAAIAIPNDVTSYEFLGRSLTIAYGCRLEWTRQVNTAPVFSCDLLRLLDGSALSGGQKAPIRITGGKIAAVSGTVNLCAGNGRNVILDSEITGAAELLLSGYASASSSPYATYTFNGFNTNYTGNITVRQRLITNDANYTRNNYEVAFNTLSITNALALGGNLPSATPKALLLSRYAQLFINGNTTLSAESNRGIFIEDLGRISVSSSRTAPYTFRMETPLAINGTFWKEGVGTLELAGTMAFGADGTSATPEADKNNFIVTGGVVRVCSADALNGAAVTVSAGTALELAVNLSDAELTQYGIRNVKTDTPFTLEAGVDTLPLTLNVAGVTPTAERFTVNYLTVTQTAIANGLGAKLPTIANPFPGYRMTRVVSSDDVAGTVTYGLRFSSNGTRLFIR